VRLFVAIPLPADIARRAAAVLPESIGGLRRVAAENLHLTLAFLGATPDERLDEVRAAATDATRTIAPFRFVLDRGGRFPARGRPRVVWLGLSEGEESVVRLGAGVSAALRARALSFDDRPLSPHLTLARVREDASSQDARAVGAAIEGLDVPRLVVEVREIAVMRSVLSPKGASYSVVAAAALSGGAPAARNERL
jgi:2'-5' RNA ligase